MPILELNPCLAPRPAWRGLAVVSLASALTGLVAPRLPACGPWLPEQILTSRQVILRTPVGDFAQEVIALTEADGAPALPPGCARQPWSPRPPAGDRPGETEPAEPDPFAKEASALRAALAKRALPPRQQDEIIQAYQSFRAELSRTAPASENFGVSRENAGKSLAERSHPSAPQGGMAALSVLPPELSKELPVEWADYLEGAGRFRHGDLVGASTAWERLLSRPPPERLDCSIQAAYMLARLEDDPTLPAAENARRYQRVRALHAEGCRDPYNLVPDSFGWEARRALDGNDLPAAARLYYLQAVTGGTSDDPDMIRGSLRAVASAALGEPDGNPAAMAAAVRDPFLRRVGTLYVACRRHFGPEENAFSAAEVGEAARQKGVEQAWLAALTGAGVDTVREAAPIAWAAYQEGDFGQAAAWLAKAPATDDLALWLRAKLALRDGKTDAAARCFAQAVHRYPATANRITNDLDDDIGLAEDGAAFRTSQFQADLGIISLARSDYSQALTALVKSGFWNDAAYVAERVLTVAELQAYVRANFPQAPPPVEPAPQPESYPYGEESRWASYEPPLDLLHTLQAQVAPARSTNPAAYCLRYLLARRLARAGRYAEARPCYPSALWPKFDEYVAARKLGGDHGEPRAKRADALWRAAKITRWLGMELFGTEDEPDWFVYNGAYEGDSYRDDRLGRSTPRESWGEPTPTPFPEQVPPVGHGEQRRIVRDQVRPEQRFHYRYLAADLAWQAAALMPDEQQDTAHVLAAGGLWLLSRDEAQASDRFYQAIVRRCGRTELGQQAERSKALPTVPHEDP